MSKILEVYLNTSGPVKALKGERLVLNCTATGALNTRVNISWDYPRKVRPTCQNYFFPFFGGLFCVRFALFCLFLIIIKLQRDSGIMVMG